MKKSKKLRVKSSANNGASSLNSVVDRWINLHGGELSSEGFSPMRNLAELGLDLPQSEYKFPYRDGFGESSLDAKGWGKLISWADLNGNLCMGRLPLNVRKADAIIRYPEEGLFETDSCGDPLIVELSAIVLHFRVVCRWFSEYQELFVTAYEPGGKRRFSPEFVSSIEEGDLDFQSLSSWDELEIDFKSFSSVLERGHSDAKRRLAKIIKETESDLGEDRERRRVRLDEYYDGLKREQEEEQKSVYFHLYYFEREEKIKKRMERYRKEREAVLADDKGLFDVWGDVELTSVALFRVPAYPFTKDSKHWGIEAVTGTLI